MRNGMQKWNWKTAVSGYIIEERAYATAPALTSGMWKKIAEKTEKTYKMTRFTVKTIKNMNDFIIYCKKICEEVIKLYILSSENKK